MSYSAPAPVSRGFSLARASALAPAVWAPGTISAYFVFDGREAALVSNLASITAWSSPRRSSTSFRTDPLVGNQIVIGP
jgi:hypothetical protein